MDNLSKTFDEALKKINVYDNAIQLLFEKPKILTELNNLSKKTVSLQLLTNDIKNTIAVAKEEQVIRSKLVLKKLQKQQLMLIKLLEIMENTIVPRPAAMKIEKEKMPLSNLNVQTSLNKLSAEKSLPRMSISDFQNSPYISKMKPVSLNFLDFEAQLTQKQFDIVPKYMKGRESLDELNSFFETVIIQCFNEKYTLIHKNRDAVKATDKNLWNVFRHQINYFPGRKFITQGDVARSLGRLIDKKSNTRIQILKHLGFLKEERKESTICYVWNIN